MKKVILAISLISFLTGLTSCNDNPTDINNPQIQLSERDKTISVKQSEFGISFFQSVVLSHLSRNPSENVIVSPLSAGYALTMMANGTNPSQAETIGQALGLDDISEINAYYSKLLNYLPNNDSRINFRISNNMWVDNSYAINPSFRQTMASFLGFQPVNGPIKTNPSKMVTTINDWTNRHTDGLINNLVLEKDIQNKKVVLVNTVFFKAKWLHEFEKYDGPSFFNGAKKKENAYLMEKEFFTGYAEKEGTKIVKIPYKDKRFDFIALLPSEDYGSMSDFIASLDNDGLYYNELSYKTGLCHVIMPRFNATGTISLDDYCRNYLSLDGTFDWSNAGVTDGPDNSKLIQVFNLSVDEKGTTAAVATTDVILTAPAPEFSLVLDRPFVFFVTESETNTMILAGVINSVIN